MFVDLLAGSFGSSSAFPVRGPSRVFRRCATLLEWLLVVVWQVRACAIDLDSLDRELVLVFVCFKKVFGHREQ